MQISQKKLAQMAGVGRSTIIEIEKDIGRTSIETIEKIANILGVPIYQLFSNERLYLESERIVSDFCLDVSESRFKKGYILIKIKLKKEPK